MNWPPFLIGLNHILQYSSLEDFTSRFSFSYPFLIALKIRDRSGVISTRNFLLPLPSPNHQPFLGKEMVTLSDSTTVTSFGHKNKSGRSFIYTYFRNLKRGVVSGTLWASCIQ